MREEREERKHLLGLHTLRMACYSRGCHLARLSHTCEQSEEIIIPVTHQLNFECRCPLERAINDEKDASISNKHGVEG